MKAETQSNAIAGVTLRCASRIDDVARIFNAMVVISEVVSALGSLGGRPGSAPVGPRATGH